MTNDLSAAELLWGAWRTGTQLVGLPEDIRPSNALEGMAIQTRLEELAGPGFGWKIGATTATARALLGVEEPFAGRMFAQFRHAEGEVIPADSVMLPIAEPEFAFRMARDLDPAVEHTVDDVLDAVDSMLLAIEMPDSRYKDFANVGIDQILADSGYSKRFVAGRDVPQWRELDLVAQPVTLLRDGEEFARGTGSAVLGDPRIALHWLALELPRLGRQLKAGDIVTTGTATAPAPVFAGTHILADFGDLGTVEVQFES